MRSPTAWPTSRRIVGRTRSTCSACSSPIRIRSSHRSGCGAWYGYGARPRFRFVTVAYLILLGVLILTIGRGYYIQGCYPALFAAGAVAIEGAIASKRRALGAAIAAAILVAGLPMFPLSLPVLSLPAYMAYERAIGLSRPEPPDGSYHLINPMFADQLGWKTMSAMVAGAYWSLPPAQRKITAVFADRYAYAGALDYYGPHYGLPTVISPNNSVLSLGHARLQRAFRLRRRRHRLLPAAPLVRQRAPDRGLPERLSLDAGGTAADLSLHEAARTACGDVAGLQILRPLGAESFP